MEDLSIAEIGRVLVRVELLLSQHDDKLAAIKDQVVRTNGRVGMHDIEIRDIKGVFSRALWAAVALNTSIISGLVIWWVTHSSK